MAIFLGVVGAAACHEHIADREADEIRRDLDLASLPLAEAISAFEAAENFVDRIPELAHAAFEGCIKIMPGDGSSKVFLSRFAQFCTTVPSPDWDGVWPLAEKQAAEFGALP